MLREDCCMYVVKVNEETAELVRGCKGLDDLYCLNGDCRFFKTQEQLAKQQEKSYQREEYQEWLASQKKTKLFDGEVKPW